MVYYVIEVQTESASGAVIPFVYVDRNEAEAKYHSLLAVCAKSNVPKHGAVLFNEDGFIIKSEIYNHNVVAE